MINSSTPHREALRALAAAHQDHISGPLIVVVVLVLAALYVLACIIWPFSACARCDGNGKFRSPSGKAWRNCRRCRGTGARIRYGRRAWTYITRTRDDAKPPRRKR